ncbi:MAG TPA: hypothetical protein VKS21_12970 [Spirochaetota bacterium]|nr:hypothetical protein [Spirochaetota bacterium]
MNYKEISYNNHKALAITTNNVKMIILTDCGPRIAYCAPVAEKNLFFEDTQERGLDQWKLIGGHRVWPTRPDADESQDAYRPDNDPCTVSENKEVLTITGAEDPVLKIKKGISIKIIDDNTFAVTNFITNTGPMLYACGVWALTCTDPGQGNTYAVPLGNDNPHWNCFRIIYPKAWAGHTSPVNDRQITMNDELLLLKPQGRETKRMLEAPAGIIAMKAEDQKCIFAKKSEFIPNGNYPLGTNLAFYVGPDNFMVEIETMGVEQTLYPGETNTNQEIWAITAGKEDIASARDLKNIFR